MYFRIYTLADSKMNISFLGPWLEGEDESSITQLGWEWTQLSYIKTRNPTAYIEIIAEYGYLRKYSY